MSQRAVGFIADLHLTPEQPQIMRLFIQLLTNPPPIQTLYILGDLFEYWIGDDAYPDGYAPVIEAMNQATGNGLNLVVMHGNRDFLIGNNFARETGCQLIDNDSVIEINGEKVLITHGDLLCSDDADYLKLYNTIRTQEWKQNFLSKSAKERIAFAEQLREKSKEEIAKKSYSDLDVNQQTVERTMGKFGVTTLIHGHTHKQNVHTFQNSEGNDCKRYVLGDWKPTEGNILIFENHADTFQKISS